MGDDTTVTDTTPAAPPDRGRLELMCRMVGLEPPRYRRADVERLGGIAHDDSVRWWRAMGFPEVPEGEVAFSDSDVVMVRRLAELVGAGLIDDADVLRLARLLGSSFSRLAEAQIAILDELLALRPETEAGVAPGEQFGAIALTGDPTLNALLEESLLYVWRRHLLAALGRWFGGEGEVTEQAVGFADISGFTKLSKHLDSDELAAVVDGFETLAFEVVSGRGGRVVKLIGDEVMFVADAVPTAVDIALDLVARAVELPGSPSLHCGVAHGPTVSVGGDVFGPSVNLASRLTNVARRNGVVMPRDLVSELGERDELVVKQVRRVYDLKGIGRTRLVSVHRREPEPVEEPPPLDVPVGPMP